MMAANAQAQAQAAGAAELDFVAVIATMDDPNLRRDMMFQLPEV